MSNTFSVIVPTCGRPSIAATLASITSQMLDGDELIVLRDNSRDWGMTPRAKGMRGATGDWLLFMDDDDVYLPGAFAKIRAAVSAHGAAPCHLFRIKFPDPNKVLWDRKGAVECGNVTTQIIVCRNDKSKLGRWGSEYAGDFDFIRSTIANWGGLCDWHDVVIAEYRHQAPPAGVKLRKDLGVNEGKRRQAELNYGAPAWYGQRKVEAVPSHAYGRRDIALYATISTWRDEDVVEANVKNCFANGCDRVYLIDNDSGDDTVQRALAAGAVLGKSYRTEYYDDDLRMVIQNHLCREITEREKLPEMWWLNLDADEFVTGRNGESLRRTLETLPPEVRTLGYNSLDLYPEADEYVVGQHPAASFRLGSRKCGGVGNYGVKCDHWKHPLLRYYRGVFDAYQSRGSHGPSLPKDGSTVINEPLGETFWLFHAPFRGKRPTMERLKALCGTGRNKLDDQVTGGQGAVKRFRSMEAIYRGEWDKVDIAHTQMYGRSVVGLTPYPWRVLVPQLAWMFGGKRSLEVVT